MTKRKWIVTTSAILLVLLLLAGYAAVAAEYGSPTDPLVSASYITDVLAPDTIQKVNAIIDQRSTEFTTRLNQVLAEYSDELDGIITDFEARNENIASDAAFIDAVTTQVLARLNSGGSGTGTGTGTNVTTPPATGGETANNGGWRLVEVEKGKTLVFEVGGFVLLRIGSATCFSPGSPGLINTTQGTELESNGALQKNHLYMVTVAGRGFTATSTTNKLMVYGSYVIK